MCVVPLWYGLYMCVMARRLYSKALGKRASVTSDRGEKLMQ